MARLSPDQLIKRAERAERKRDAFASLMRDCNRYAMPERDAWSSYAPGQEKTAPDVYDDTAIIATGRFVNRFIQAVFPPQQKWARAALPPELSAEPDADALQLDLAAVTELVFRHIHASNFDQVVVEYAHDIAAGVGCLLIENGRLSTGRIGRAPLIRCQAVPAAYVAFDEGPFGGVEGVFFSQRLPARLVRRTYPDADNLPDTVLRAEAENPDQEVELLQATTYDAEEDVFRFQVLVRVEKVEIVSRSYRTLPWIVTRWTKAPGETYGRGPLTQVLPSIRTLNKLTELYLKALSIGIGGAWTATDDGVFNADTAKVVPGAIISVRSNGGSLGPTLRALEFPGRPELSEMMAEKLKTNIRQVLFDDPLPPEIQAGLTATEIIERVRRFQADTGAFGRLHQDAVAPIFTRCVDILEQAGELAAPRFQGLLDLLQNQAVRVQPTSPLAQAQDRADVQAVMMTVQGMLALGEPGLAMLKAGLRLPEAGRFVAERSGVPHELIPNKTETAQADQADAQAQQNATLLASPAVAQVAGALAKAAVQPPPQEAA